MAKVEKVWLFGTGVCLATGLGVFVLPFFFPPAFTPVMSVSIAAGFNNKIASVAAAVCAIAVFLAFLASRALAPRPEEDPAFDARPMPHGWVMGAALFVGACVAFAGWLVQLSHMRYLEDAGYFVHQLESALQYHRRLYAEIEFPYGPLIFYSPALVYRSLGGLGVSLRSCYFITLVLHQVAGVLLLGYVVNVLPMSRAWKVFALCCYSVFTLQPVLGLNYTLLRFAVPLATLLFSARQKKAGTTTALFVLGEVLNLSVSPEMGFAFGAGAVAYALMQMRLTGKVWIWGVLAVPYGVALFLLVAGRSYLRMLGLFAGGAFNFIVEPVPHILLFLAALVWIVPRMLAARWLAKSGDAALLTACLVLCTALVPVAFGRADPGHVFFNGLGLFLLSLVAVSRSSGQRQKVWGASIAIVMLMGLSLDYYLFERPLRLVVRHNQRLYAAVKRTSVSPVQLEPPFDGDALAALVGTDSVATPIEITLQAEGVLKQRGQYRPSFYCFLMGILDANAEKRKIREFNEAKWAMLPTGMDYVLSDTQKSADTMIGIPLPYRMKRPSWVMGKLLAANFAARWVSVGTVGEYTVYRNTRVEPEQARP